MNKVAFAHQTRGFSILELVLAMGIFLTVLSMGFISLKTSQTSYIRQQAQTLALGDYRRTLDALKKQIGQAAYIYPPGIDITVASGLKGLTQANKVTTGKNALVLLLQRPEGSNQYDGRIFYLSKRSFFTGSATEPSQVSSSYTTPTNDVLVEARTTTPVNATVPSTITWTVNTLPTNTVTLASWSSATMQEAVLAENIYVNATDVNATTNLLKSTSTLSYAVSAFDQTAFTAGICKSSDPNCSANPQTDNRTTAEKKAALISGVGFTLGFARSANTASASNLNNTQYVLARNIPRTGY